MPYIGQGLSEGRRRAYNFIATINQTTFLATYDVGYLDVFQNGILLAPTDYTATNGTSVILDTGAAANDEITIISHQLFSVTDTISATQGGTFAGDITVSADITTTGSIKGPATFTIDPAVHGANSGTVVIAGNLQVDGTQTTINSTTLTVDDKNIVLGSGSADSTTASGSGLTIDLGSSGTATMLYTHATTSLDFNKPVNIAGNLGVTGTVDGVDIAARDAVLTSTATTAGAALPKAGGAMTGPITTNSTFDGVDIAVRDAVLTATTTTANAALPKAGGSLSGDLSFTGGGLISNGATGNTLVISGSTAVDTGGNITLEGNTASDASHIKFKNGSTEVMRIAGGNVGIGANPDVKLEVNGGADGSVVFAGRSDGGTGNNRRFNLIAYANGGGANYGGGLKIQTRSATNVFADAITVQSNTNVGIGTVSPLTTLMLESTGGNLTSGNAIKSSTMKGLTINAQEGAAHVNKTGVWIGSNGSHWSGMAGGRSNTSTWGTDLRFYTHEDNTADLTYSRERMIITSEGNVGIGTATPAYKLSVLSDSSLTNSEADLGVYHSFLNSNATTNTGSAIGLGSNSNLGVIMYAQRIGSNNEHKLGFQVRNSSGSSLTKMTILGNGNVGIGTGSPSAPLHIRQNTSDAYTATNYNDKAALTIQSNNADTNYTGIRFTNSVGNYEHFLGSVQTSANTADMVFQGYDRSASAYKEYLRITDSGNVGIGTSSPGEKLSVSGSVSGSSYRIVDGSTISYSGSVGRNTKIKAPSGTDVGISLYNSANTWAMQLYADGNNSYGFLNGDWAGWDLKKTVGASGGNLYMNNTTNYWLNANGTSKTYQHLVGGISNTAGGAVFKVGSSANNGELSLNSVNAGSDIVSYNRSTGTYHPLNYYAGSHNTFIGGTNMWSVDATGHIKTQYGNTGGYGQTSGSGGIAIVNDQGSIGCSLISVTNAARGWSNFYINRIHTTGQDTRFMQFTVNGSGATGYIRLASASTMTYGTSSDYRLKENVVYDWDATTRLKQLKPARFNFILDGDDVVQDGFMAHEVSDIVPLAVQGTKDAMKEEDYEVTPAVYDSEGNETEAAVMGTRTAIDPQGIDHSMLVPLLVKTIQELEARLSKLENA